MHARAAVGPTALLERRADQDFQSPI
jgi:hypothetical protein